MTALLKIMADEYGAGAGIFNPTPILWAASLLADQVSVEAAKAAVRELNLRRERLLLPVAVAEYGSRLF